MAYVNKSDIYKLFDESNGVIRLHVADVDMLPTAEVAEVKHGYWIDKDDKYGRVFCSVCCAQERPWDSQYKSPRCPMCGAKMDGKRRDK